MSEPDPIEEQLKARLKLIDFVEQGNGSREIFDIAKILAKECADLRRLCRDALNGRDDYGLGEDRYISYSVLEMMETTSEGREVTWEK